MTGSHGNQLRKIHEHTRRLAVKKQTPNFHIFAARTKHYIFSMFLSMLKKAHYLQVEEPYSNWYLCQRYLFLYMVGRQSIEMKSATAFFTELYYPKLNLTSSSTRCTKFDIAMWKAPKNTNQIFVFGSPQTNKDKILTISIFYLRARES